MRNRNEAEEFSEMIREYEGLIYNIAYRMLGNREDAKDAAQEACIKAYKSFAKLKDKEASRAWVCKITANACIDALRKRDRKRIISSAPEEDFFNIKSGEKTPEEIYIDKERIIEIMDALNKLRPKHKALIVLRDINGLSYEEIAFAVNLPIGTVKSRLSRARENMARIIEEKRNKQDNKSSLLNEGR